MWDAPKDVKVNPQVLPYHFTDYALAADGSVQSDNPDWYWEVSFPENFTPVPNWTAVAIVDQNSAIWQYGISGVSHLHSPSEHTVDG